jgi:hypothetical protein
LVEECGQVLLLDFEDHIETVDRESEVDGKGKEENAEEGFEDGY